MPGFVKPLRHHHGLFHPEAQAGARGLLQGRGNKRRRWFRAGGPLLTLADGQGAGVFQCLLVGTGIITVVGPERLAVMLGHLQAQGFAVTAVGVAVQLPEFFRDKGANFTLALHHQLHGHRLHPAGGQATGNFFPQQRGNHETHYPIQKTSGLLGFHPVQVQLAGFFERRLDRFLGNFVEHHPVEPVILSANDFPQMPGNRLPFAVQIRCQIDAVSFRSQALEFVDHLVLARKHLIMGRPAFFRVDPHAVNQLLLGLLLFIGIPLFLGQGTGIRRLLGPLLRGALFGTATDRQIPHMADTGLHDEVVAQVAVNGLGLGRRLHNY